jgi:KaiC/GvpD/RAD55 family RecA-like ATPase
MGKAGGKAKARKKGIERISTGIKGLDNLMEGGFIKGSCVLLAGSTGTGKTIFCAQYLHEGLKRGEKCLYITLEESPDDIIGDVERFGWDFRKYAQNGQLTIIYKNPFELVSLPREFLSAITQKGYMRVAIDSTSVVGLYFKNPFEARKQLFVTLNALKRTGATTVITAEAPEDGHMLTRFGVEEYITDGVLTLHYLGLGGSEYHSLQIRKMRRTDHGKDVYPMRITGDGITIKKTELSS